MGCDKQCFVKSNISLSLYSDSTMEKEHETIFPQEQDLLHRSNKKTKQNINGEPISQAGEEIGMEMDEHERDGNATEPREKQGHPMSFRDCLMRNSSHMTYSTFSNPCWTEDEAADGLSDADESEIAEDPKCPTIRLSKEQKQRMRALWKKALIIKMFDRGLGTCNLRSV